MHHSLTLSLTAMVDSLASEISTISSLDRNLHVNQFTESLLVFKKLCLSKHLKHSVQGKSVEGRKK